MATEVLIRPQVREDKGAKVSRREPLWCLAFLLVAAVLLLQRRVKSHVE